MKRKPRVVHLIYTLANGGTENVLLRTLPLIKANSVVVTMNRNGALNEEFVAKNIKVVNVGADSKWDLKSLWKLLKILNQIKPDLIITHLFHADMIGRLWLQLVTKFRVIPYLQTTYNYKDYRLARMVERLTKFLVSKYLANSKAVAQFYYEKLGVKNGKIEVIPNGIDLSLFNTGKQKSKKEELGIGKYKLVIVCVANLFPNKGHRYLVEAFADLKQYKDACLLLLGEGPERTVLENIIKVNDIKNIFLLGKRRDVKDILRMSDIFVLPTFFEGLSNAIMEAMACGLPVVTTKIRENEELVSDGLNGLLCKVADKTSLEEAMGKLIVDSKLRHEMGNKGRLIIENEFSLEKVALSWDKFIKKNS